MKKYFFIISIFFLSIFFASSSYSQTCTMSFGLDYPNYPAGYPNTGDNTNYMNTVNAYKAACASKPGLYLNYATGLNEEPRKMYYCAGNCSCPAGQEGYSQGVDHHGVTIPACRPVCPAGTTRVGDTSECLSTSSSSISSSSSSSAPSCTTTQYFDSLLNSCAELVDNASDCASQQYAMTVGNKFSCHQQQPDNTYCDVNIVVGGETQKTVYSCEPASPNSASSAPSSASASSTSTNTSQPSSASNSSLSTQQQVQQNCELTFGTGNCALNTTSTPCPNSYRQNGVTFCVTTPNSGSTSSSGSGSGSSAGAGSGSGSSASSGNATASNCNTEPVCTGGDPIQCAFLKQMWINNCDGIEKKIDIDAHTDNSNIQSEFNDLIDNNQTALNSDGTIAGSTGEIDVSQYADMVANLNNAANQTSSGSCPAPRIINISLGSFEISFDPLCQLAEGISYFVLLFFSLSGSLIIYRTVEKI